jgi:uncharacterized protein YbjT (DUF2867 family)
MRDIFGAGRVLLRSLTLLGALGSLFAGWAAVAVAAAPASPPSAAAGPQVLLVVGATGGTGREVVRQALAQGFAVRALVRDATRARTQFGDSVAYVVGDVRTGAGIAAAMQGADYVVSALGSNVRNDPENTPERVDYGGVKALAEAAAAARVKHFVLVSSMGATHVDHPLNRRFGNILIWKLKGEDALRGSGVPYTVVRPGGLRDSPGGATGVKAFQGDDLSNQGSIPRADVATVCLAALGNAAARGKTFELVADTATARTDLDALFAGLAADVR